MSTAEAQRSSALRFLDHEASRNPRALDLARFISPAVFVEPELLRAIRVHVMPKLDVGVEADVWFGKLVRARGVDGIRLHHAVAKELRNQLKEVWNQGGASVRQRVKGAQQVMEKVHKNLSPALFLEERLSWLSIYGDQEAIENELGKVLVAISERDRPGLLRWWANASGRLPDDVLQSRSAWLLRQAVSARVGHVRLKVAVTPNGLHEIDLRTFLASVPDVRMGVRRKNNQLELGEIEGEGATAIMLPETDPRLVEISFQEQNDLKREYVSVPLGEVVQLSIGLGAVELRTARDAVYRLPEIKEGGRKRATGYRRVFLSHTAEFAMYPGKKSFVDAAIGAVIRAGCVPCDMEYFTARDERPAQYCMDRVRECDVYVGIIGFRYGSPVRDRPEISYAELEFEAASMAPAQTRLVFLLDSVAPVPVKQFTDVKYGERQEAFRERLSDAGIICKLFSDAHELEKLIYQALKEDEGWWGESSAGQVRIDWPEGKSPYPGMEWFDKEYAPLFFGRDREVDALIHKMSEPRGRVLLVNGAVGAGKSSLVAAGLWQALMKDGRIPGSTDWVWQRIQPGDGETPFHSLAWGLKQVFPRISKRAPDLANELAGNQTMIGGLLASQLVRAQELVLFVDQLEELFTGSFREPDIQTFLEQLIDTARGETNRLRVVASIRSEFLGKLEAYESMLNLLNSPYRYHLGPVSPRMLQDMIEKPAEATGYSFEPGLVERILNETWQESGNLALVEYALKQLFEMRKGRMFTSEAYERIGGVVGAIERKANEVLSSLDDEVRGAFDAVFTELVHIDRERPPTRRRAAMSVFNSNQAAMKLIEALAGPDCRVLVVSGSGHEAILEVAHEKLFMAWPKLQQWISESGEALREIDHAEEEARRWQKEGNNPQELWLGSRAKKVLAALEQFGRHPSRELQLFLQPQEVLIGQLDHDQLSHQDRLLIGQKLAEFGDTRPGVGLRLDGLPDIVWIDIPGGEVQLKDVPRVLNVEPLRISKYPVTNAQFDAFLNAPDGYRNGEWWRNIKQSHVVTQSFWVETNSPRETVSWYEAVAFCRWLSARTRTSIRLPTEWEWQQVASGGDPAHKYPWGGDWDGSRCNSDESRINRTTAVGMYPNGATKQGVLDMAGNVLEWCLNTYIELDTTIFTDGERVVRGGSWYGDPALLHPSGRDRINVDTWYGSLGFRLAQDIEP